MSDFETLFDRIMQEHDLIVPDDLREDTIIMCRGICDLALRLRAFPLPSAFEPEAVISVRRVEHRK